MSESLIFPGGHNECLKLWREQVRACVEADDYVRFVLWEKFSKTNPDLARPSFPRVKWEQGSPGFMFTIPGDHFYTSISVNVDRLDGKLCLFWTCTSRKCDWEAAENWIRENFQKAVIFSDARNFGKVINTLREP